MNNKSLRQCEGDLRAENENVNKPLLSVRQVRYNRGTHRCQEKKEEAYKC